MTPDNRSVSIYKISEESRKGNDFLKKRLLLAEDIGFLSKPDRSLDEHDIYYSHECIDFGRYLDRSSMEPGDVEARLYHFNEGFNGARLILFSSNGNPNNAAIYGNDKEKSRILGNLKDYLDLVLEEVN